MKAVVFGYHALGCVGFDALLETGFTVVAVVTHADAPAEEIWWDSLADRARAAGVPVHVEDDPADPRVRALVAAAAPDFVFSFYYRRMIPEAVLALAGRGAFNVHGSLLPRFRGRAPVNWVLVRGESVTGVSLHAMVAKPDAGDLVDAERVPIDPRDTAFTLYAKIADASRTLLRRALPRLRDGTATLSPLDLAAGSYYGGRTPEDGRIDWSLPASRLYDLVRAVTHPYPGAFTTWRGRRLLVWWALPVEGGGAGSPGTVLTVDREGVVVACGAGALRLITVQAEGAPELPACAFAVWSGLAPSNRLGIEGDVP